MTPRAPAQARGPVLVGQRSAGRAGLGQRGYATGEPRGREQGAHPGRAFRHQQIERDADRGVATDDPVIGHASVQLDAVRFIERDFYGDALAPMERVGDAGQPESGWRRVDRARGPAVHGRGAIEKEAVARPIPSARAERADREDPCGHESGERDTDRDTDRTVGFRAPVDERCGGDQRDRDGQPEQRLIGKGEAGPPDSARQRRRQRHQRSGQVVGRRPGLFDRVQSDSVGGSTRAPTRHGQRGLRAEEGERRHSQRELARSTDQHDGDEPRQE